MESLDNALSYHLLCPIERFRKDNDHKITISGQTHHLITTSYLVDDDVEGEKKSNHLHSLIWRNRDKHEQYYGLCSACPIMIFDKAYYFCNYCKRDFHKECVESPSVFRSSDHPKHPLQLLRFSEYYYYHRKQCFSCREKSGSLFYYCSICDFMIHYFCSRNPTSLTIDIQRRHEHTLQYFPTRCAIVCDVCGLEDNSDYLYVCLLCDFVVHKRCVYFPYVIKVSRHDHRLAFTPNLLDKEWIDCGVCHTKINEDCGRYSCMKGCSYALHSRCAMRSDICDGKELEGEIEETYENIKMYEEEGDGIIRHLSHPDHQMSLEKMIHSVYDENKRCQACILPFYDDGNVYQCMQCDFILHESCVHISRVKQVMLHVHPLTLKPSKRWFGCKKCKRLSCGFKYVCREERCNWELDILCASIYEPFNYHSHPHQLFMTYDENTRKRCSICQWEVRQPLNCVKCDFVLCFRCATLPHKARYKRDEHFLTFYYEKYDNNEVYWCEICEEDINPKKGLYACNECGITLHVRCLLGSDLYLQPGLSRKLSDITINVLPNTCSTRPICKICRRHCPYKTTLELPDYGIVCSSQCIEESSE